MSELEEFLDDKINRFENMASKRRVSKVELKIAKSIVANRLLYVALLQFPNKEKRIRDYLSKRGYDSEKGRKKEQSDRSIRKSGLEQESEYN